MTFRETFSAAACLLCLLAVAIAAPLQAQPIPMTKAPDVVAKVNGQEIGREDLADLAINVFGQEVLDRLIQQELVRQEAEKQGVTVTPEEIAAFTNERIEEQIRDLARQLGLTETDDVEAAFKKMGTSVEDLRKSARERLEPHVWYELVSRKLLRREINVTEDDLREEFDARFGAKVRVRQVVLAARQEADDVLKKLRMGADFDKVAQEVSIDRITRSRGGEMPPLPVAGDAGKAVAGFDPLQISEVVEIEGRFHIFQLLENIKAVEADFEKEKDALREDVVEFRMQRDGPGWLKRLVQEAKIERFL